MGPIPSNGNCMRGIGEEWGQSIIKWPTDKIPLDRQLFIKLRRIGRSEPPNSGLPDAMTCIKVFSTGFERNRSGLKVRIKGHRELLVQYMYRSPTPHITCVRRDPCCSTGCLTSEPTISTGRCFSMVIRLTSPTDAPVSLLRTCTRMCGTCLQVLQHSDKTNQSNKCLYPCYMCSSVVIRLTSPTDALVSGCCSHVHVCLRESGMRREVFAVGFVDEEGASIPQPGWCQRSPGTRLSGDAMIRPDFQRTCPTSTKRRCRRGIQRFRDTPPRWQEVPQQLILIVTGMDGGNLHPRELGRHEVGIARRSRDKTYTRRRHLDHM
uniref:Uncharacterized protein n=1 Tax=Branchiostoma floridae TaxID=7739 RepID=C3YVH1_BRAFL|eukprot:XP_002599682.1 hypothetical protein BRAFLDRAFT_70359 [Branchiostoma floridae]